jgi:preprotein translocase subunit SecA
MEHITLCMYSAISRKKGTNLQPIPCHTAVLKALFALSRHDTRDVAKINALREEYSRLADPELARLAQNTAELLPLLAATAVIAERVLGERMFDVQLRGALALARGSIAEMQTGEGKTLTAVPAIAWLARNEGSVHVMTVNDYLARRDAQWMGEIYRRLGLSVACIQQSTPAAERRAAYAADIVYATANEIGFDFLRDQIALRASDQVQRPYHAVVIDEADSILIDEARVPLVIAGAGQSDSGLAFVANDIARRLRPGLHYSADPGGRNAGIRVAESMLSSGSLFDERNLRLHTALADALHAHALLRRDVDYLVKDGAIEMVDEFRGRIALDRRWPAGLHTAIEVKEGVATKQQGMILGSITMQHLTALYARVCGMTGTAASSAVELQTMCLLPVEIIPTNRPMIRVDQPDRLFPSKAAKDRAVVDEIREAHLRGQPVLVGTASIAESESLSRRLDGIPHSVLNAKNDAAEAEIIAQAGQRGAVTISTNMAGRGTDIKLGSGVAALGGLYVIGTNKHESRRIDNQLRGRAGRQGDPGCSRFFISLHDDLLVKYRDLNPRFNNDPDSLQRLVEGQNLDSRIFLNKYEMPIEGQRHRIQTHRQNVLTGEIPSESEAARIATLRAIDDAWADYLAQVAEYRSGLHWLSWGGRDPHREYMLAIHQWFAETEKRVADARAGVGTDLSERGAVWTYVTTDQPFGTLSERIMKGLFRRFGKQN